MANTYVTTQGDEWDHIAYNLWGKESLFSLLLEANPQHRHMVVFGAGVVLLVPDLPEEADSLVVAKRRAPWKQ